MFGLEFHPYEIMGTAVALWFISAFVAALPPEDKIESEMGKFFIRLANILVANVDKISTIGGKLKNLHPK